MSICHVYIYTFHTRDMATYQHKPFLLMRICAYTYLFIFHHIYIHIFMYMHVYKGFSIVSTQSLRAQTLFNIFNHSHECSVLKKEIEEHKHSAERRQQRLLEDLRQTEDQRAHLDKVYHASVAKVAEVEAQLASVRQDLGAQVQLMAALGNILQYTSIHCNKLQGTAVRCNALQHSEAHYNTRQDFGTGAGNETCICGIYTKKRVHTKPAL